MNHDAVRGLLNDVFEELGLFLGGVAVVDHVDDDIIDRLARGVSSLRKRAIRQLEQAPLPEESTPVVPGVVQPHPAIERLLAEIREDCDRVLAR